MRLRPAFPVPIHPGHQPHFKKLSEEEGVTWTNQLPAGTRRYRECKRSALLVARARVHVPLYKSEVGRFRWGITGLFW